MSRNREYSLRFYEYLCQKIGSEEDVKARRITSTVCDIGNRSFKLIRSGSNGEGLYLKGSDLDIMVIYSNCTVYEYNSEIPVINKTIPLVMDTEDTQPCFTKLRIVRGHSLSYIAEVVLHTDHKGEVFSSKLFKETELDRLSTKYEFFYKIHGPCMADINNQLDLAICFKCDKWISHSEPWIKRSREKWPSADVISKIISCGVLFVPIGSKGSINEHIEWRLSFSVAEKFLIFSFNHAQLLCYALLKIFLREIVDKDKCLKGLLCSYFIKTVMFWILEESDPSIWRPDNIIPCFQACLHRLLYCVENDILLHYFIPENNLFYLRFNKINRNKLCKLLQISYQHGVQFLFSAETLNCYPNCPFEINQSLIGNARLVNEIHGTLSCGIYVGEENIYMLLRTLLHRSRSAMSAAIFTFFLSRAHQTVPHCSLIPRGSNIQSYLKLKNIISHLLVGLHSDAVTGWIMLASFFYEQKYYFTSLYIINHTLLKCTDEKIQLDPSFVKRSLNWNQINALNMVTNENLITSLKTLTMNILHFGERSLIIPTELQLEVQKDAYIIYPTPYAHFLGFLCCYHLSDYSSCNHFMHQLLQDFENILIIKIETDAFVLCHIPKCIAIAYQMLGETKKATFWLQVAWR
ncbi:Hypothetical predicted protein, partial [Mytilus galloprovincialis]